jgi:hypothetical protein
MGMADWEVSLELGRDADRLRKRVEELEKALNGVCWQKDCGCDGPAYEGGPIINHADVERDAMYEIAREALGDKYTGPQNR